MCFIVADKTVHANDYPYRIPYSLTKTLRQSLGLYNMRGEGGGANTNFVNSKFTFVSRHLTGN